MSLYVKGITSHSLLFYRCPCGDLNVLGFWHQLQPRVDARRRVAAVAVQCRKCGAASERRYRLTSSKRQHRLLPWIPWGYRLLAVLPHWCPRRFAWFIATAVLWLERRVPV